MVDGEEPHEGGGAVALRVGVELFFWGAVLVVLGHVLSYRPPEAMRVAPHARLGRMLVLIGACFVHGGLSNTRLARWSAVFACVCGAQFVLTIVAWAGFHFGLFGEIVARPAAIMRVQSLEIAFDLAVLVALVQLLGAGGVISRAGHRLGLVFYGSLSLTALAAPAVLGRQFWLHVHTYLSSETSQPPLAAGRVIVIVLTLVVLIRAHRLLGSGAFARLEISTPGDDGGGGDAAS
jgi:hypothetical protein